MLLLPVYIMQQVISENLLDMYYENLANSLFVVIGNNK